VTTDLRTIYLNDVIARYRGLKSLADGAIVQLEGDELFQLFSEGGNSVAHLMKHVAGNMISRWSDFLTSDGESATRNRDAEFEIGEADDADSLLAAWDQGWQTLLTTLESLTPDDLEKEVLIRGEPHSVIEAINRQIAHYGMHVGQIVLLAKQFRRADWKTLSIAKGRSQEFNAKMSDRRDSSYRKGMPSERSP
jgi:hypothetical protein